MKELVIFDLDGTLLYTVPDIAAATNQALRACGYPEHSEEVIASFIGNGINKLFERALPEDRREEAEVLRIRSLFLPYYDAHCCDMTRPFEGIHPLLLDLCAEGVKVAVASNKYHPATVKVVSHFFPNVSFCAVLGERVGIPRKPDPAIVFEILKIAQVCDTSSVLYVGDSGVDMQTAINASLEAAAVTWGCRTRQELAAYNPAHLLDTPSSLRTLLL